MSMPLSVLGFAPLPAHRLLALGLGAVLALGLGSGVEAADLRSVSWGMDKNDVKAAEDLKVLHEDDASLAYATTLAGLDVILTYGFGLSGLWRASYTATEERVDRNDHLADYAMLKGLLSEKYGPPLQDDSFWVGDLYRNDPTRWGLAVSVGALAYLASWQTEATTIQLDLYGKDFEVVLRVLYRSRALGSRDRLPSEQKALEDL